MMMARKYNRRILTKGLTPNEMAIQDSSNMNVSTIEFIANGNDKIKNDLMKIKTVLADAKEYGSILNVPEVGFEAIYAAIEACQDREGDLIAEIEKKNAKSEVLPIVRQVQIMAQKYDVCVTNPLYMEVLVWVQSLIHMLKSIFRIVSRIYLPYSLRSVEVF